MSGGDPAENGRGGAGERDVRVLDANAHREASLAGWEAAAPGWRRRHAAITRFGAPVSAWMLDAVALQPGERVLELAAGMGETGMLAAEQVAPIGGAIVSDHAEAMLEGARARAEQLGLSNVEFQVFGAEWIDLPLASVDVVLCRWGYMLLADPPAALAETRRVLRPGGRVALAVWDSIQHNPWASLPILELIERGLTPGPTSAAVPGETAAPGRTAAPGETAAAGETAAPGEAGWQPGIFALGDPGLVRELLGDAGFSEIDVQAVEVVQGYETYEDLWETALDINHTFHDAVLSRPEPEIEQIKDGLRARLAPYISAEGRVAIPGRSLVARASA